MMIGEKKWRLLLVKVVSSPSFPRSSCRKRVLALKRSRKRKSVDIRHFIERIKRTQKHGLKINAIHGRRRKHEARLD